VADIIADHEQRQPVGIDSPLDRLQKTGAMVLMIGCGLETCTLIHLAEVYADVPYLGLYPSDRDEPYGVLRQGDRLVDVPIAQRPGCSQGFTKMTAGLQAAGVMREGRIGGAQVMCCDAEALLHTAVELLRDRPLGYLCDTRCLRCMRARHLYGRTGGQP